MAGAFISMGTVGSLRAPGLVVYARSRLLMIVSVFLWRVKKRRFMLSLLNQKPEFIDSGF